MSEIGVVLRITKVGDREALDALNNLDAAGRRIVNSVSGVTGKAMGDTAAAFRRAGEAGQDAFRSVAVQADMAAAATNRVATSTGMHGLQVGRLRMELGTLVGRLTGTSTALDRMGGAMGAMALGEGAIISGLVGVAAGVSVWKAWHEGVGKAAEEQQKLTDALTKWYDTQKLGRDGALLKQIDAMKDHVRALRKEMDDLAAGKSLAGAGAVGEGGSRMNAWLRILTAGSPMQVATQFGVEMARGANAIATGVKEGGKAIAAATKEVHQRNLDEMEREQKEWLAAYEKAENERQRMRDLRVQGIVGRLTNADSRALSPIERINRASNRDDTARGVGKIDLGGPDMADLGGQIRDAGKQAAEGIKDNPFLQAQDALDRHVKELGEHMRSVLSQTLGAGLASGFEAAFSGAGIGASFESLTATVMNGLGSFLEQLGGGMIVTGTFLQAFADAMGTLDGIAAVAAGVGLIAAGAAMKTIGGSFGSSHSSSYGGSYGSAGLSAIVDRQTIMPGSYSTTDPRTIQAQQPITFNLGVINPNDAGVHRVIDEVNRQINQRGSLAGERR